MSSEDGDLFRQMRDAQQKRRAERLPIRQSEIEQLIELGYEVKKLTEYQYRINDQIDLYPIHHRYFIIKTNKRGNYNVGRLVEFIKQNIQL